MMQEQEQPSSTTLGGDRQVLGLLGQLLQQLQGHVSPVALSQQGHQLAVPPRSLQGSLACGKVHRVGPLHEAQQGSCVGHHQHGLRTGDGEGCGVRAAC